MPEPQKELQQFRKDTEYFVAHEPELLAQYPEQWVAILNEQVVGADPDFDRLLDELEEAGVPYERALIQHVTHNDETFILPG